MPVFTAAPSQAVSPLFSMVRLCISYHAGKKEVLNARAAPQNLETQVD